MERRDAGVRLTHGHGLMATASAVLASPPSPEEERLSQVVAVLLTAIVAILTRSVANWRVVQFRAERERAVSRAGARCLDPTILPASLALIAHPSQVRRGLHRCGPIITPKPDTNFASSQSEIISSIRTTSRAGSWAAG